MQITPIKTTAVHAGDSLYALVDAALPVVAEGTVLCITSKIISLCENAVIPMDAVPDKRALIEREAEAFLPADPHSQYQICLTIKNHMLIPTAGIDESNSANSYILYPRDIQKSAQDLWDYLRHKHKLTQLGILITDSHSTPLRRGVTGLGIGWCGFKALYDYRGKEDCFGRPLRYTQVNILDALAASAVFVMGEGNEQTPIALIKDAPKITFQDHPPTTDEIAEITITLENDLYAPILMRAPWVKT